MATVGQSHQLNHKPTLWKWSFPSKTMPSVYESALWLLMKHRHQQIIALIVHIMHCLSLLLCQELPKPGIPSDQYPKSQRCKFRLSHCACALSRSHTTSSARVLGLTILSSVLWPIIKISWKCNYNYFRTFQVILLTVKQANFPAVT